MHELQVINKWDLKTFQIQLRALEVVHQEYFGIINFIKYSAKPRTRFNPRTTTLAIRQQNTNIWMTPLVNVKHLT